MAARRRPARRFSALQAYHLPHALRQGKQRGRTMYIRRPSISPAALCIWRGLQRPSIRIVAASAYENISCPYKTFHHLLH